MQVSTLCALEAALLLSATASLALDPTPTDHQNVADVEARKAAMADTSIPPDPIHVDVGGDTIATATVIPGLPYSDAGSTANYGSDYESCVGCFSCPFSPVGARDVVYKLVPTTDTCVAIDLCSSSYDTKVYVGDGGATSIIACNDDACGTGLPGPWQSQIVALPLAAGHTYYIFVDGYSASDYGPYVLDVIDLSCGYPVVCPPEALLENEPTCHNNYDDSFNGGCNSVLPTFSALPCGAPGATTTVCGTYGVFDYYGITYRDTDWYQITLTEPSTISWCVVGEYGTLCGIIDGNNGCPVTSFYDYTSGSAGTLLCVTQDLPAGTWWLWVGTSDWNLSWVCGGEYVATLTGYDCGPVTVEPATWGRIKGIHR